MGEAAKDIDPYEVVASASDPDGWQAARDQLITASRVPAIVGMDPYCSPLERWLIDTGQTADEDDEDNEPAEWGIRLEAVIREAYEDRTGRRTAPGQLLLRSTAYDWLGATLDAWVEIDGVWVPLEIKTSNPWRGAWSEGVPDYYAPQVQTQMLVTDSPRASVTCLIGGQKLVYHDIERDPDMGARIIEQTREHRRRIDEWDPPPPDGSESAERALLRLYPEADTGTAIMLSQTDVEASERIEAINKEMRGLEAEKKLLRQQIEASLGTAERGILPGGTHCWAWRNKQRKAYTVEEKTIRELRKVKVK